MHIFISKILKKWISEYNLVHEIENTAIIMAGNFPLAGLHDLISVIISGNNAIIKPASDDKILIEYFVNYLYTKFPKTKDLIRINYGKLIDFDKVNNSTKLSTDADGMFFNFYTDSLPKGRTYAFDFLIRRNGRDTVVKDAASKFKVV